ncbi:homeodomain-interacting protein kinase 1-like [Hippoglossus stenolepis]|uniref:homeodomain-interacting protein kinase 1-like n=1 Tax=Hippoglossus stenolepis TaxID=195615 RepID=UPI00159C7EA1|nr:homeodomain-interacting protein kinase 1-like [Hippoglossus stenolepis]
MELDEQMKSGDSEESQSRILCSGTNRYLINKVCGEGTFGKVVKAVNLNTSQEVALKMLKNDSSAPREMRMLEAMSALDPTTKNMVHCIETFKDCGKTCLVFERLDMSLYQLLTKQHWCPLTLNEIRPIAHQLLTAFDALKSIGLVHADLKLDNVMLVNHMRKPFRVKLIDFGLSFKTSENMHGKKTQPRGYRAPEVSLGLPISEKIDMWGLGCLLLALYLANHPFSVDCEYQGMKGIVDMLGQPPHHLLKAGKHTCKFFMKDKHWCNPGWSMKIPTEYERGTGIQTKRWVGQINRLDDLITDNMESPYLMDCMDKMKVLDLEDKSDGVAEEDPVVHSSDGVEHTDHPCDEAAAADIDADGSAVKESAESPDVHDSDKDKQVYEETLKRMRTWHVGLSSSILSSWSLSTESLGWQEPYVPTKLT